MKYLAHFFKFWYPEASKIFVRIWKNLISVIEEDLAVSLMYKLLFTPLFHDSSFIGKVMSFFFRLSRILLGLFAFLLTTIFIGVLAVIWFLLPLLIFITLIIPGFKNLFLIFSGMFVFGLSLFINHILHKPFKKVWQIKNISDVMDATKLNDSDLDWEKLFKSPDTKDILVSLEIPNLGFSPQPIKTDEQFKLKVWELSKKTEAQFITPAYFWITMLFEVPGVDEELLKFNLNREDFIGALRYLEHKRNKWRRFYLWDSEFAVRHLKGTNRGWLGAPTPSLDSISTDLTRQAAQYGYPEFIGRPHIVSEVSSILSQARDKNVLLVGPAGSGKSALIKHIAAKIIAGDAPPSLATKRLVQLEIPKLLSGVTSQGDLAAKIKTSFEEIEQIENIVLFIDEIHNLGIGEAASSYNLFSLLTPYLESDKFQFIASTEIENYNKIIERNSSFVSIFNKVEMPPASKEDTFLILLEEAINILRQDKLNLTYTAIKDLTEKSNKYIHDRVLPDSALSVLESCKVETTDGVITAEIVDRVISKKVNVPVTELGTDQKELVLNLEDKIHERLIDQVEAVKKVSDTLKRSAAGVREQNRPIGSFLFVGPTGVGKTELAKILSEIYFKKEGSFLRFDMSEYQTTDSINRLIGSEQVPGELTEAVLHKPYLLILLDEFEKADPKILNLFLQVLDDGRLTDYSGKHIDFTNTIIIATSNAASLIIAESLKSGKSETEMDALVKNELLKIFKPELLNRFDAVVSFKPLSPEDLQRVVQIKLEQLKAMVKETGYLIEFTPELTIELGRAGYDPVLGARPLRRLIQDTVEAKLSNLILTGDIKKGEVFTIGLEMLQ